MWEEDIESLVSGAIAAMLSLGSWTEQALEAIAAGDFVPPALRATRMDAAYREAVERAAAKIHAVQQAKK